MNTKLMLKLEQVILAKAKDYAKSHGASLPKLNSKIKTNSA
jgi:hypothetical protein